MAEWWQEDSRFRMRTRLARSRAASRLSSDPMVQEKDRQALKSFDECNDSLILDPAVLRLGTEAPTQLPHRKECHFGKKGDGQYF